MEKDKKSESRIVVEEIVDEIKEEAKPAEEKADNKSSANFNIFWIILPGVMLLGLLMGGIIAYSSGINKLKSNEENTITKASPQPTIIAAASPSASPVPKVDLTKYKIKVLNGSGIKGEAGKVKDLLEKAGFTVESTGNTKTYDYTKTIIQARDDVSKDFLTQLKGALGKSYVVDEKAQTLSASSKDEIIITVGTSTP